MELYSNKGLTEKQIQIREDCLNDFYTYVKIISPYLQLGHCHEDVCNFIQSPGTHKLVIFPRGHLKSTIEALWASYLVTRDPTTTILIASATATLAEQQLYAVQNIFESKIHRKMFPELLGDTSVGTREKWTQKALNVEHPARKEARVRDNTIYSCGAGKTITGLHFDYLFLDDIAVEDSDKLNPFTPEGRAKTSRWVARTVSILNPGGGILVVGTRYHPDDIYSELMTIGTPVFDEDGNIVDEVKLYKSISHVVETGGDFLWPRKKAMDGKFYGFDFEELAKIKAQFKNNLSQFYANYYNDPTDPENRLIDPSCFQYYDKDKLENYAYKWFIDNKELTIFAGMDMAASLEKRADFTTLAVIGVDEDGFRYILDIQRKKTDQISVMSDMVFDAFVKWRFKKFRIETNAAQGLVANQIEANMRKRNAIFVWDKQASRGKKSVRIMSILEPLYSGKVMFHYRGGQIEILEDELLSTRAAHDDVADAVAMTCEIVPIVARRRRNKNKQSNVIIHPKWGGVMACG